MDRASVNDVLENKENVVNTVFSLTSLRWVSTSQESFPIEGFV